MSSVTFPDGFRLETLAKAHARNAFDSGELPVDDWLKTKALQQQSKRLSTTRVLVDDANRLAGYYTLATGQVDFGDLPTELAKPLPRRLLPTAVLAWLGVHRSNQGQGLGTRLLASALRDAFEAGKTFAFIAVIVDCLNDQAKQFYQRFQFRELPGHPYRLFLSSQQLDALMADG